MARGILMLYVVMEKIGDILSKFSAFPQSKPHGGVHSWQDEAVRAWKALKQQYTPSASFFKCFRDDLDAARGALSFTVDAVAHSPVKLFYWRYNALHRKNIKT